MAKASHPTPRGGLFAKIDLRWTDLLGHAAAGRKRRRSSGGYRAGSVNLTRERPSALAMNLDSRGTELHHLLVFGAALGQCGQRAPL